MRENPAEILQLVPTEPPSAPSVAPRVALNEIERRVVTALLAGDASTAVVEHVVSRASALAGPDGPAVRRRSVSKGIAVLEMQLTQLSLLLSEAAARRDSDAVDLLDRAVAGVTKRLCALLQEHRFEETRGLRSAVVVGVANNVTVQGGK